MVSLRIKLEENDTRIYTAWDLIFFLLFDRWLVIFDVPTFLIMFIDPITPKRLVPFLIFLHWAIRNSGQLLWGFLRYFCHVNKVKNAWKYTTGLPTLPWYIGELCLDAYPFLKAHAVAKGRLWLTVICYVGFVPLVVAKLGFVCFRYLYAFVYAQDESDYFALATPGDAIILGITAWSDLLNSFVIVYAGAENKRLVRNDFLSNLVRTTELRIVVSTILTCVAVTFTVADNCTQDPVIGGSCQFRGARSIAIDTVYTLYLLDYLIIKFHKVFQTEKTVRANQQQPRVEHAKGKATQRAWPVLGLGRRSSLTNMGQASTTNMDKSVTDVDTPSFMILKRNIMAQGPSNGFYLKSHPGAASVVTSLGESALTEESEVEDTVRAPVVAGPLVSQLKAGEISEPDSPLTVESIALNGYQRIESENEPNTWYQPTTAAVQQRVAAIPSRSDRLIDRSKGKSKP